MSALPRDHRYTFVLLITQADDVGLLRGEIRALLGVLYPNDEDVTPAILQGWLDRLEAAGFIRTFTVPDGRILWVRNWLDHQRIDHPSRSYLLDELKAAGLDTTEIEGRRSAAPETPAADIPKEPAGYTLRCTVAANKGFEELLAGVYSPIVASCEAAPATWEAAGVPVELAERVCYERARSFKGKPGKRQFHSLAYLNAVIREEFERSRAVAPAITAPAHAAAVHIFPEDRL